jgi:SAM-dependent methyltransferase
VLCGYRPRPLENPFRWCDTGCGQGFTALGVAALYPHAEVFGIDYNPSHIENATRLASEAGLSNVMFSDASFEALANAPENTWPKMDFIVLHGVWRWVSATQRQHILRFIARHLAPGGIVYNGYNALAGWAAMLPVQKLLRHIRATQPGDSGQIIAAGHEALRVMLQNNAALFSDNPIVARRLEFLNQQDQNYYAHELLHEHWTPFSPDEVAADSLRCNAVSSAAQLCWRILTSSPFHRRWRRSSAPFSIRPPRKSCAILEPPACSAAIFSGAARKSLCPAITWQH